MSRLMATRYKGRTRRRVAERTALRNRGVLVPGPLWPCGGPKLEPCSVKLKTYSVTAETRVQPILDEFADVFKEELGCYRGGEVGIDVDPDVQPRFFKPRTVPLAFRVTPIPAPDPVTESAAASARHAPVPGQLASTPDRLPAPDRAPAPGRPPVPAPPGLTGAVPAPGVTTVPPSAPSPSAPRYRLRDRSTLRPPDRYVASYE
ncbi:sulfated surface glycoprotein 185-like [Amphibalanus amphitrite]|uniref:sulfated surface glycoprotein 185-like n=1 Tax=Amphibalanus amphitrite TaxID=1232801 RepID=UPI001C911BCC|nr:sulfated surface glycoprotein 185-like [Amphibalanus amphitrite]